MQRSILAFFFWAPLGVLVGACGSAPLVDTGDDKVRAGASDASILPDGGLGAEAANRDSLLGSGDLIEGSGKCQPKSCKQQELNCGPVADGCGGLVECGQCDEGESCGIVDANVCTALSSLCVELPKKEACEGKSCGEVGDGCSGTHQCGECDESKLCGVKTPFQCDDAMSGGTCETAVASCAEAGVECGQVGDGCGGLIDCDDELGGCASGQVCGAVMAQRCDALADCIPLSIDAACAGKCGIVSNGCGVEVENGLIDCSSVPEYRCAEGTACGGGGVANECGTGEGACVALTQEQACESIACGASSDGCDASLDCGSCAGDKQCRDGACADACEPTQKAEACASKECGATSDGCGSSYDCGSCRDGETCGILTAFECGSSLPSVCIPQSAVSACADRECGSVYDGCGTAAENVIDCGAISGGCDSGQFCGIVETFQCDEPPPPSCTPSANCAAIGYACGFAIDECGTVLDCSSEGLECDSATETCIGGIDGPTECVSGGVTGGSTANCDVCDGIPDCTDAVQSMQLTGRVTTPGRDDDDSANQVGVPNAFVYILRNNDASELPDITSGLPIEGNTYGTSCDRCEDQDLGPVLASATTDAFGSFILEDNIPVDEEFVLVVKIGKWRRAEKITLNASTACTTATLPTTSARIPRNQNDGLMVNIPRVAVSTGRVDAMECVFYKMGLSEGEFSEPGDDGEASQRVHMYRSGDRGGASMTTGNTSHSALYRDQERINTYDMLVFDCESRKYDHDSHDYKIREFVNRGGRLFASHWSYSWIFDNGSQAYDPDDPYDTGLSQSADWGSGFSDSDTGWVSVGRPRSNATKIQNFADWLQYEGAATVDEQGRYALDIIDPRDLAASVNEFSEEFVYREPSNNESSVQQYAFNTPYGAPEDEICGRVAYSGFHVVADSGTDYRDAVFPQHCAGNLTSQEKVLLYMLFDLGACVTTEIPAPPSCSAVADCTGRCGLIADGCGSSLNCGTDCGAGQACLAGGVCGTPTCTPATCAAEGATCGLISDGCGAILDCDECPAGQECGLLVPNQCALTCTPTDSETACSNACGFVSDGCGGVHECPDCSGGLSCVQGTCTSNQCVPLTECPADLECGASSDGCSGTLNCGQCTLPEVCGGGGIANTCGSPACTPLTCQASETECGWLGDGCGAAVNCGICPAGQACGLGGAGKCGGCTPVSCDDAGAACGAIGDGCGNIAQCGTCPSGQSCGATVANQCGTGGTCSPQSCGDVGAECGIVGDGCGATADCGDCPEGELCGLDSPFQCGAPSCTPTTCDAEQAQCGALGDGCGGLLDCGPCAAGYQCGVASPNQCSPAPTEAH